MPATLLWRPLLPDLVYNHLGRFLLALSFSDPPLLT